MKQFHQLKVIAKSNETLDSVRVALEVPEDQRDEFVFLPGQHLPVHVVRDGVTLRRTYSICSAPGQWPLEIGVRVQPGGRFSEYAAQELAVGDQLGVMPPVGRFHASPDAGNNKFYLGFAAGSGITPILSIVTAVLRDEPDSCFALFYGNRRQATTMFIDDLFALKNRYPDRLQLHFVFSQEDQEFPIGAGRLDRDKVRELFQAFCAGRQANEAYVCGPDSMIETVSDALSELGMDKDNVHTERFGVPGKDAAARKPDVSTAAEHAKVTVILDGHKKSFDMVDSDENIVDAAAEHGIDLPYSCKSGVCATCRCHLREGEVTMATNYALEPWEVDKGFILACQSRPKSKILILDYDKT